MLVFAGDLVPPGASRATLLYVAMYPVMMLGLALFVRRRSAGRNTSALIDGLIVTVGLALPTWILLIAPYLQADGASLADQLVSVALPIGDVILLGAAVQLALDGGRRGGSFFLLVASIAALLLTDFAAGLVTLAGESDDQIWLNVCWMVSYVLWGGAALHPSMPSLGEPTPTREYVLLTPTRLALLTGASLIAPVISALHHIQGHELAFLVVDASSIALFGLVIARMVGLARRQRALGEELHRRRGEERFAALVRHATDLLMVLQPGGGITYASPSVDRILGSDPGASFLLSEDRMRVRAAIASAHAGLEVAPFECTLVDINDQQRVFEVHLTNLIDEEHVGGILVNARDVTERKAFEAQLTHQAFHDTVTGLANRALFVERVRDAIARARRTDGSLAVVFVDLDDFKTINDSLGHAAGDEVLIEVARRLDGAVRGADAAARFGGDEFAVLLEGAGSQAAADAAQRILDALAPRSTRSSAWSACAPASASPSRSTSDDRTAEELLRDADAAMYVAKRDGKGGYRLFEPVMHADVVARLELRTDLRRAIDAGELELHYQPVVRLSDGDDVRLRGADALASPRARARLAARVHPARRGDRADRPDGSLGAARGGRAPACARRRLPDERQPLGQAAPGPRPRRGCPGRDHRARPGDGSCSS